MRAIDAIVNSKENQGRLMKQIGGALFGVLISLGVCGSIETGAEFIFVEEAEQWGLAFWGDHYILRIIASLFGTVSGSFSAGCIAKYKGGVWGLVSTLPTSLFWIIVGAMALSRSFGSNVVYQITLIHWVVILVLLIASPIIGFYFGSYGQNVRLDNPQIFESRPNLILGIKWYHWFWLFTIMYWIIILGTFSIFQGMILFFATSHSTFISNVNPTIAAILIGISLCLLGLSSVKIFYILIDGYRKGLTKGKMIIRIFGWILVILLMVGSFQAATGYFLIP